MAARHVSCTPDGLVKGVTLVFWGMMLAGAVVVGTVGGPLGILQWLLVAIMLATPLFVMAQAPRGYGVRDGALHVERLMGDVVVPVDAIASATPVRMEELGRLLRTFGSGGAHGYFGRFRSSTLGPLNFQATRRDRLVLVTRNDGAPALVLSPDDPDALLAALKGS